jgi:pheromone shutdown protein TraB
MVWYFRREAMKNILRGSVTSPEYKTTTHHTPHISITHTLSGTHKPLSISLVSRSSRSRHQHITFLLLVLICEKTPSFETSRTMRIPTRLLRGLVASFLLLASVEGSLFFRRRGNKRISYSGLVPPPEDTAASPFSDNNSTIIPAWKAQLPEPLCNKTKTLQRIVFEGGADSSDGRKIVQVYLLGTAHVSTDSCKEVKLLLEAVNPSTVFIEMCDQRTPILWSQPKNLPATNATKNGSADEVKGKLSFWGKLKQNNATTLYGTAATLLTSMQEDFADSLGVELGGEFRAAFDYWERNRKSTRRHLILGDRPLYLTLTRAWESLNLWSKFKLLVGLLISSFQKPNPEEIREWMQSILREDSEDLLSKSIEELSRHFPTLVDVIIRERDAYMACKLFQTCQQLSMMQSTNEHVVVAIVGAGHVEGMCRWLTVGNGQEPDQILSMLIKTKKPIPEEHAQFLIDSVSELDPVLLADMASSYSS